MSTRWRLLLLVWEALAGPYVALHIYHENHPNSAVFRSCSEENSSQELRRMGNAQNGPQHSRCAGSAVETPRVQRTILQTHGENALKSPSPLVSKPKATNTQRHPLRLSYNTYASFPTTSEVNG